MHCGDLTPTDSNRNCCPLPHRPCKGVGRFSHAEQNRRFGTISQDQGALGGNIGLRRRIWAWIGTAHASFPLDCKLDIDEGPVGPWWLVTASESCRFREGSKKSTVLLHHCVHSHCGRLMIVTVPFFGLQRGPRRAALHPRRGLNI